MGEFGRLLDDEGVFAIGPACNSEFRRLYADRLRKSLSPGHLRQAWLFLGARQRTIAPYGQPYHRLVRFEGNARVPPVRWQPADAWVTRQIRQALRSTDWGRSLSAAADAFWAEQGAALADDSRACPATAAEDTGFRSQMIAKMLEQREGRR